MTEKIDQIEPPPGGKRRNRNFEETHEALSDAYVSFITNQNPVYPNPKMKQPTIVQLSTITGFATRTVERHLVELDKDVNMNRRVKKYRLGADLILKSWLRSAVKGNVPAGEKYLQVVEQINFGSIIKVENYDMETGPDLTKLDKADLAAYKALVKKMTSKVDRGSPKSAP